MYTFGRKSGISVLVACQNEEATLGLCLQSFLEFADEIIVVDNGSIDRSKEIAEDFQANYPKRIKFFYVPELPDLYHNRQYAYRNSSYRWVVRADADFIAYTEGEYNVLKFRGKLLQLRRSILPKVFGMPLPNVIADFWHTGVEHPETQLGTHDPGRYIPLPVTKPTLRIYETFPGFKFQRVGRWEGTSFNRLLWWRRTELDKPLWMHCGLKSDRSFLYRSERTNWREHGDFNRYPTLDSYLREVIKSKYGTDDIDEAAHFYMQNNIYPYLQKYEPKKYYPYPILVKKQMAKNPIYKIHEVNGIKLRKYSSSHHT